MLDRSPAPPAAPPTALPGDLLDSPLLRRGGFDVLDGLLNPDSLQALLAEAATLMPGASESRVDTRDHHEGRGGTPARKFLSSPGGSAQDAFYTAPWLVGVLQDVTGLPVHPTGERGTFTYYARTGDYLDLHRDVEHCDLAVITCLHDDGPHAGPGGALRLYPRHAAQPLSAVRADPGGAVDVRLHPGHTAILYGGIVPHEVLPTEPGQRRIVSVLCYEVIA